MINAVWNTTETDATKAQHIQTAGYSGVKYLQLIGSLANIWLLKSTVLPLAIEQQFFS